MRTRPFLTDRGVHGFSVRGNLTGDGPLQVKSKISLHRIERVGLYCFVAVVVVANLAELSKMIWHCVSALR